MTKAAQGLFCAISVENSCKFLGKPVWKAENLLNETCAEFVDISSGYQGRCAQQISTPLNAAHGFFSRIFVCLCIAWRAGKRGRQ
jgi:hypothetical protein